MELTKEETGIYVGMKLYREITFRSSPNEIKEYTISKIGNKYFYLAENSDRPINKETLRYIDKNYSQSNFTLYRSKEEIERKNELRRLYDKVQKMFSHYTNNNFTIEQLRKVAEILEPASTLNNQ